MLTNAIKRTRRSAHVVRMLSTKEVPSADDTAVRSLMARRIELVEVALARGRGSVAGWRDCWFTCSLLFGGGSLYYGCAALGEGVYGNAKVYGAGAIAWGCLSWFTAAVGADRDAKLKRLDKLAGDAAYLRKQCVDRGDLNAIAGLVEDVETGGKEDEVFD